MIVAPTVVGSLLVVTAWRGGVGWESIALEAGVALALAAMLIVYERHVTVRLNRHLDEVQAAVDTRLAEIERSVDERLEHLKSIDDRGHAADAERHTRVVADWIGDPTPSTFLDMADLAGRLGRSQAVMVELSAGAALAFAPANGGTVSVNVLDQERTQIANLHWDTSRRHTLEDLRAPIVEALVKARLYAGATFSMGGDVVGTVGDHFERLFVAAYSGSER